MLRDFNMELEVGQIHVITGKSGSGKSTLFRAIGGALRPEAGRILYYGKEMYEDELKIRKRMSVFILLQQRAWNTRDCKARVQQLKPRNSNAFCYANGI